MTEEERQGHRTLTNPNSFCRTLRAERTNIIELNDTRFLCLH